MWCGEGEGGQEKRGQGNKDESKYTKRDQNDGITEWIGKGRKMGGKWIKMVGRVRHVSEEMTNKYRGKGSLSARSARWG